METTYTLMIKELFQEYYKRNISVEDYRLQRSRIINEMDVALNGYKDSYGECINPDITLKNY